MDLMQTLGITRGITAIIGSGGKTTLLLALAAQLPGRVVVCTTTKIYIPALPLYTADDTAQLTRQLQRSRVVCVGVPTTAGKLTAPLLAMDTLQQVADYVLVEADGSKHLPIKAHLEHEPVIPQLANRVILLVGASGFGQPIHQVVHRPEQYCALTGKKLEDPVTPQDVAHVICREQLCDAVVVNQLQRPEDWVHAAVIARQLPRLSVYGAALQEHICRKIDPC